VIVIVATASLVPAFGPVGAALAQFTGTASDALIRGYTLRRTLAEVAASTPHASGSNT
jgi:O-antigen/teichoic acid export membrane protein